MYEQLSTDEYNEKEKNQLEVGIESILNKHFIIKDKIETYFENKIFYVHKEKEIEIIINIPKKYITTNRIDIVVIETKKYHSIYISQYSEYSFQIDIENEKILQEINGIKNKFILKGIFNSQ